MKQAIFSIEHIAKAANCKIPAWASPTLPISFVSRFVSNIHSGTLYIDVNRDDSEFRPSPMEIIQLHPAVVLTPRADKYPDTRSTIVLPCHDCIAVIGQLSSQHRRCFNVLSVGITGSVGKTTTTSILAYMVGKTGGVLSTVQNENDEIGVPIRIFELNSAHQSLVFEMATWRHGEISFIANIVKPKIGIVTNIGWSHYSRFGSMDAIARAKAELITAIPSDGVIVLNKDDLYTPQLVTYADCKILYFSIKESADVQLVDYHLTVDGSQFKIKLHGKIYALELSIPGMHNIQNALAAILVADYLGVSLNSIDHSLRTFKANEAGRLQKNICNNDIIVIDDAYNASPASVKAATSVLRLYGNRRRIAVFGGVDELGSLSVNLHQEMFEELLLTFDLLIVCGSVLPIITSFPFEASRIIIINNKDKCIETLLRLVEAGDVVLFKASHAYQLSRLAMAFVREIGLNVEPS